MSFLQIDKVKQLVLGAILTGIAVVIGRSWGDLIHSIVSKMVRHYKCHGKQGKALVHCIRVQDTKSHNDPLVMSINALFTTIILVLIMVPLWQISL
jgi:hypothetical protein